MSSRLTTARMGFATSPSIGVLGGGRVVYRPLLRADHEEDRLHLVLTAEHADKHWVSTVDDNVWEPGTHGWEEALDE